MTTNISINSSIYKKMQNIALSQNCDLRECLERALNEYIDNYEDSSSSDLENLLPNERVFFLSVAE